MRVNENPPTPRHRPQQLVKLPEDGIEILVDVGVIEFEVVEHQRARPVVHELGSLIKERRVVFVGLDHEKLGVAVARRHPEIGRDAAHEKTGRKARVLEYPGQYAGSRGLAVSTRDREHMPAAQNVVGQPPRSRRVGQATIQHRFDHVDAAAHDIADDDPVGFFVQLCRVETLVDVDAQVLQLGAHRRVDIAVAAADTHARGARQRSYTAHERAADAEYVNMHGLPQDAGATRLYRMYCKMNTVMAISIPVYQ